MRIEFQGFFDLQVNGFAGVDFNTPGCTPDQLSHTTEALQATGVTRFLPTLITSSLDRFSSCARSILRFSHPAIAGIHLEGPYISPDDGPRGAHPREQVIPASIEDFCRRQEAASGRIALVTLAPEVPGALSLIEYLVKSDVRVAIGHTAARPEQIREAVSAGATLATHLGNGCAQSLPRHPNFIWEQLADDELFASFIADGHHLPPATLKSMVRAKQPARSILVTDATAAATCRPGYYTIGEAPIELTAAGRVFAPGATNLAGSALAMHQAVANTVRFTGLPLSQALQMASTLPAHYLGLEPAGRVTAEWDEENSVLTVDQVCMADV
jgi:N-acetylglucosamine-6-phosphate deacetylase